MTATAITPCHQQRASKAVLQIALTSSPDNHLKTWGLSFSRLHRRHTRFEGSDGRARTRSHPSSQGRRKIPEIFILVLPPPLTLCSGGLQTSPAQGQTITVFRCAGQIISATTPLSAIAARTEAATGNLCVNLTYSRGPGLNSAHGTYFAKPGSRSLKPKGTRFPLLNSGDHDPAWPCKPRGGSRDHSAGPSMGLHIVLDG